MLGRPELFAAKGEFRLRALSLERFGLGEHLAAIERLKQTLAAEGLFDASRKRALPRFPRRIGLVTGSDAAARRDVITHDPDPLPARARARRRDARAGAARRRRDRRGAARRSAAEPEIDVVILTRGGGSFDDLLPFSDERVVRAVAACPVPVVSAVGHEQDTPLCDLAADVRASTPTAAGQARRARPRGAPRRADAGARLARTLRAPARSSGSARGSTRTRSALERGARRTLDRDAQRMSRCSASASAAARRSSLERRRAAIERADGRLAALSPRATLGRGYAIVRSGDDGPAQYRRPRRRATASRSSSPRAPSAPAWRTCP